jgi:hypothetical protein
MKKLFVLIMASVLFCTLTVAQSASSDIYGTVTLADGSRIPGVAVTLTGDVIAKRTTVSSEHGNYRFLQLPPGNYQLQFELEGFKTIVQKGIRLFVGKNQTINVQMETSNIKQVIEVTGKVGVIDTRKTTVGATVTKEMIESLPTARNPWTILSSLPGVMIDRLDIGGADSGQQSNFLAGGGDQDDTTWNVDGANVTDPSAIGAAPAYLNINAYEELQVTLGSNDITAQTGGVQLNFVTKRAGNNYSGDFHLYVEDKAWEMSQTPTEYMVDNDLVVPGVDRLYMYGLNLGGPIIKDKIWWMGSWAIQDIHKRTEANLEDATWLVSGYAKINFQLGNTSGDFHISHDAKKKWGRTRLSPSQQNNGSLWDQDGPGFLYYGGLSHVFGNLMLNANVVYTDGGFGLDPRGSAIDPETGHEMGNDSRYVDGNYLYDSTSNYFTNRNSLNMAIDGNYFLEGALGGDHEIKFGVDYYTATTTSQSLQPNQRILYTYTDSPSSNYIRVAPDYASDVGFKRVSAYIQDTVTFGKLTASVGLRYDKEQGKVNAFTQPYFTWYEPGSPHHGERMWADIITAIESDGFTPDAAWTMLSPRISLTYDFTGDGMNVIKLSAGRYMSQSGNNIAGNYIPYRLGFASWNDANADSVPQYEEIGGMWYDAPFRQTDPVSGLNRVTYADDYNTSYLDELTLTFEKGITNDLAVFVTGFYKKKHNLSNDVDSRGESAQVSKGVMADGSIETKANWEPAGTVNVGGQDVPIFEQIETPVGIYYHNLEKSYYRYLALQFQLVKKLSNKWMANVSFTFQDWKRHLDESEILDMNNFDFFNGGQVSPATTGSGLRDIWVNSRWIAKVSGMFQLPWGINITGFLQAKEGYPQPVRRQVSGLNQGTEYIYLPGKKSGDERLPTLWMLNLGLEKRLVVSDKVTATLVLDWYNVTNNQIVQKYQLNLASNADAPEYRPSMWMQAGLFQFGVRVSF